MWVLVYMLGNEIITHIDTINKFNKYLDVVTSVITYILTDC